MTTSETVLDVGLAALRRISRIDSCILQRYFLDIIPSLCFLLQSAGPTKVAAQRTVALVLDFNEQEDAVRNYLAAEGSTVKSVLTETFLRRLQRMVDDNKEDEEKY